MCLHWWVSSEVNAKLIKNLIQGNDGSVLEVVLEGQGHVHFADWHANGQSVVVLDGVPLPVGVVQQVPSLHIGVLQGDVLDQLGHLQSAGHHVDLAASQGLHVGTVLGVHEVPALAANSLFCFKFIMYIV